MSTQTQEAGKLEQLSHESPDEIEVAAGREREQLEGWVPELAEEAKFARGRRRPLTNPGTSPSRARTAARWRAISTTAAPALRWPSRSCASCLRIAVAALTFPIPILRPL